MNSAHSSPVSGLLPYVEDQTAHLSSKQSLRNIQTETVGVDKTFEPQPWIGFPSTAVKVFQSFSCVHLENGTPHHLDAHAEERLSEWVAEENAGEAFYMIDLGVVARRMQVWQQLLPRVHPFYAVKCCGDSGLLATLASMGANFDCASPAEMQSVLDLGVTPDRIVYANPCKPARHISFSRTAGVDLTTFDTATELAKCARLYPGGRLLLRLRCDDPAARCPLGDKYGAELHEAEELIRLALSLNLQIVGLSFHVGSGATDPKSFTRAIAEARKVWETGLELGALFSILDIGGGFSGTVSSSSSTSLLPESIPCPDESESSLSSESSSGSLASLAFPLYSSFLDGVALENVAAAINYALDTYFPSHEGVKFIAEPGRYFAESSATLYCSIFSKRVRHQPEVSKLIEDDAGEQNGAVGPDTHAYWIGDGLYGSFNSVLYDHATIETRTLKKGGSCNGGLCDDQELHYSTLFGPTCDGLDTILRNVPLPELKLGDWLVFPNMGAYTLAAGSNFNGFGSADIPIVYVASEHE
mmetsp:Transcript_8218/g.11094  ORF Transcript_8218/g.11094 Transcript_8218/m.11094 type:complete len:529 (+) Transcript_8218:595-2181(+)|eukprot:CAMPEP_0196583860 /NCGR_PEP_ID=MMETSP1081-20130531/44981_1 /TAXON_ID=36882 /ORGANISM="Pyramimonas amylifera, Strain CCMP720" /LENGTH=528 /DNA_ID=CAMNT_0041904887 /DNA_START=566 /DNA_END=2152 /DNA_ORIENTATION=+